MLKTRIKEIRQSKGMSLRMLADISGTSKESIINLETGRTVGKGALLNKELLAEKEKINCVWLYMTAREYAQLRQMGAGKNFFRLNYYDATTMTKKTKEFYGSDITATEVNGLDRMTSRKAIKPSNGAL